MFARIARAWRAARSAWTADPAPTAVDRGPQRVDRDTAARALARIVIAQTYRLDLEPGDSFPHHVLFMRRYQVTPLEYAAKCARCSDAELRDLVEAAIDLEVLEKGIMPGASWSLPSKAESMLAITTLHGWHEPRRPRSRTTDGAPPPPPPPQQRPGGSYAG